VQGVPSQADPPLELTNRRAILEDGEAPRLGDAVELVPQDRVPGVSAVHPDLMLASVLRAGLH
jgi:hypothetical protein